MLSQFCIRRPIFATVLSLLIILAGLVAVYTLPLAQYPNITPPTISISTTYSGADAVTIARTVSARLEDQISGVDGMLYYTSSIRQNGDLRISCVFDVGTDPDDAMLEINNRVRTAERNLPEVVRNYGVTVRKRQTDSLLLAALYSPDSSRSSIELAEYANIYLEDELKRIRGVGDVNFYGNAASAMRIWLDPDRLAHYNLTPVDVCTAIQNQNKQFAAGSIGEEPAPKNQRLSMVVRARGQLLTPEEFGNIILSADAAGGVVHLRDVADIGIGKRSYSPFNAYNKFPAITMAVYLQTGANAVDTATAVKAKMQELAQHFPSGMTYKVTDDSTDFVIASLKEVARTLCEAMVLVMLVVFAFLQNWRATLIPMLTVPISLIGTMAGLWCFHFSLNTLTLFAMTLSIGIVVDDAIVVIENVERLMTSEHLSPFEASCKAMQEVSGALVAIVLVLSAVFIPVAFLGGMAGELYRQFAVTVAVAITISGFVALTLTPALCAILLKPRAKQPGFLANWFNRQVVLWTRGYQAIVGFFIRFGWLSALGFAASLAAAWSLLQNVPQSFVPKEDQGLLRITVQLPEATNISRTLEFVQKIQNRILKTDGVHGTMALVGNDPVSNDVRGNTANIIIQLKHWDDRTRTAQQISEELRKFTSSLTDGSCVVLNPAPIRGLGAAGGFQGYIMARGDDNPLALQAALEDLTAALRERPELTSIRSTFRADSPQFLARVDEEKAVALGLSASQIYTSLNYMLGGYFVNNFTRNGKNLRVYIQGNEEFRSDPANMGRLHLRSSTTGKMIPLTAVCQLERISGPASLARMNGYLAAQVSGQAAQGYSSGTAIALVEKIASEVLPDGYTIGWIGQAFQEKRFGSSSAAAFVFGLIVVFLILAALYERWSLPIAIVMAIPYALTGALGFIALRGMPNDVYFQIGLLVLIGLAAKNAILIVAFAEQKLQEGLSVKDAALAAAGLRMRPILMTSLAFILGIAPLVWAHGAGAAARQSMGTGVFGGMLAATFVATLFIPVFFTWLVSTKKRQH